MNVALFVAVAIACTGGIVAAFLVGRSVVAAIARRTRLSPEQRRTVLKSAGAFGLVALGPAVLLGVVVGGTLGARYGEMGVAMGTFAVVAALLCSCGAAGACLGRVLAQRSLE